jgi:hypothetical protein
VAARFTKPVGATVSHSVARTIFNFAGFLGTEPAGTFELATALLGRNRVTCDDRQLKPFVVLSNPDAIRLRTFLDDDELHMALARALVSWWCRNHDLKLSEPELEELAMAIALPSDDFRRAAARTGGDVAALSDWFVVPASVVGLQLRRTLRPTRAGTYRRLCIAS